MMQKNWRSIDLNSELLDVVFICTLLALFAFIPTIPEINSVAKSNPGLTPIVKSASELKDSSDRLLDEEDLEDLRNRNLLFPLQGFTSQGIQDSFEEARGDHLHGAMDIVAPRNTPVVAVEAGKIARLWYSKYGGITIYQFDPTTTYAYYYAHLESYADNLKEQDLVKKGQVIGYVGTSGNAPKETPHLHFTIFKLTKEKHWWEGVPINPYKVYSSSTAQ